MSLQPPKTAHLGRRLVYILGAACFIVLVLAGVFARQGWLPNTDPLTGKRTGWFGQPLAKNAPSSWNMFAPPPSPTPLPLSREYLFAGQRLLSVIDAQAQEVPPSDLAIWRPSTGYWWVMRGDASGNYSSYYASGFGTSGDVPTPGDFDGDGKTDFAIYRPSTGYWWVNESSTGNSYSFQFGNSTDTPVPADFDGDGKTDAAFFRADDPSSGYGTFYIRRYDGTYYSVAYGLSSDIPAPADFDGDGRADVAVWRNSNTTFYSQNSTNGSTASFAFSNSASEPVPCDFDGDGKADYAIRQSSSSNWIIRNSGSATTSTVSWQNSTDKQVRNDYDGDGKCDIAVWHEAASAVWYIRPSTNTSTTRTVYWGTTADIPVPAYYRR